MNTPTSRRYLVVSWDAAADAPTDVEWMRHPFDKYWLFKPTEDGTFERHYQTRNPVAAPIMGLARVPGRSSALVEVPSVVQRRVDELEAISPEGDPGELIHPRHEEGLPCRLGAKGEATVGHSGAVADTDLVELLTGDLDEWNRRRDAGEIPNDLNLRKVDLRGANLRKANLGEADLGEAYLRGANLGEANLREANLHGANLDDANLGRADLYGADLRGANLYRANLGGADLHGADLQEANLGEANLRDANLGEANLCNAFVGLAYLYKAHLLKADMRGADMREVYLHGANLREAKMGGANLSGANLSRVDLTGANLCDATLWGADLRGVAVHGAVFDDAAVYGVNVWDMQGVPASSDGLVITLDQPQITVDDMRLAQFIYLLINNDNVRDVIDTITSKVVLILGNFSRTRKPTLDRIRGELRHRDLTPVVFDFAVPMSGRIIDTVALLARMSRYVIVDLTDPRMTPMELGEISDYGIPIQTVILAGQTPIAGLVDLQRKFHWVLPTFTFNSDEHLAASLDEYVLAPAAEKRDEMMLAT